MKLKKSLLIVPALGTLLLAAAGSVGGTVAWFSANTTYDATAGQFSVASLEGNLSCTLGDGVGTTTATNTVTVESGAFLADASYDHDNRTVWTDASNVGGAASTFTKVTALDQNTGAEATDDDLIAATFDNSTKHVYWAVTWKMTFTFVMPATGLATNLYFVHTSTVTDARQAGSSGTENTAKGFRVAWTGIGTQSTGCTANNRAWAPLRTDTPTTLKYVAGTGTGVSTAYSATNLIQSNSAGAVTNTPSGTGSKSAVNCLGQFKGNGNDEVKINFVCVAWYEGEDLAVRNTSTKDIVSNVGLNFFTLPSTD